MKSSEDNAFELKNVNHKKKELIEFLFLASD